MTYTNEIVIVVFTVLFFLYNIYTNNKFHEKTHEQIYATRNIKCKTKYSIFGGECEPIIKNTNDRIKANSTLFSHDLCEIFSYHIKPFYILALMFFIFYVIFNIVKLYILWRYSI